MGRKKQSANTTRQTPIMVQMFWHSLEEQRRREIVGVLLIALAVTAFLSLISYPVGNTESWRTIWRDSSQNLVGSPGQLIAWSLFFLTGLCAYLVPPLLTVCAWNILGRRSPGRFGVVLLPLLRLAGGIVILACCCALVSITFTGEGAAHWIAGGLIGSYLAHVMLFFGQVGSYVVLGTIVLIALLLCTDFLLSDFFCRIRLRRQRLVEWWHTLPRRAEFRELPCDEDSPPARAIKKEVDDYEEEDWAEDAEFDDIPALGLDLSDSFGEEPCASKSAYSNTKPAASCGVDDDDEDYVEPKIYTPETYALRDLKKTKQISDLSGDSDFENDPEKPYQLPTLDLLNLPSEASCGPDRDEIHSNKEVLEKTLEQFNISARVVEVHCGPVVTRYDLKPAPGVKVRGITTLQDDLALALQAYSVRIIAPVPGKNVVGIEIPNRIREDVLLREILASDKYRDEHSKLTFALGKTISGEPFVANLAKMPHLLVAGATGAGKSVGVNSLIASLLFNATPKQVRFLMVDPKRVELTLYQKIPHLLAPVVTDPKCAAAALKWAVEEMEDRYRYLSKAGVRDLNEYNERMKEWTSRPLAESDLEEMTLPGFLPYIVIIIDELADLMMVARAEVETNIARLAQMARAVGMHLVLATQRPSVNILTGVIKANFPARIAYKVAQINDSRVIIDQKGAESLLGMGDMLFDPGGASKPIRLQGCFVSTAEIERLVNHISAQQQPDYLLTDFDTEDNNSGSGDNTSGEDVDDLYLEAVDIVMEAGQASTSLLQRRLKIGYGRAARILDIMQEKGLIGPPRGSKPREVLV